MSADRQTQAAISRTPRRLRFTMVELLVASTASLLVATMVISFVVMAGRQLKSSQHQVSYNHMARFGMERMTELIRNASAVAVSADGLTVRLSMPVGNEIALFYEDADDNSATTDDNRIWCDPNPDVRNDEFELVRHVSLPADGAVFQRVGLATSVRFRIGDPRGKISAADNVSGPGYQGVDVEVLATPRNAGQLWAATE